VCRCVEKLIHQPFSPSTPGVALARARWWLALPLFNCQFDSRARGHAPVFVGGRAGDERDELSLALAGYSSLAGPSVRAVAAAVAGVATSVRGVALRRAEVERWGSSVAGRAAAAHRIARKRPRGEGDRFELADEFVVYLEQELLPIAVAGGLVAAEPGPALCRQLASLARPEDVTAFLETELLPHRGRCTMPTTGETLPSVGLVRRAKNDLRRFFDALDRCADWGTAAREHVNPARSDHVERWLESFDADVAAAGYEPRGASIYTPDDLWLYLSRRDEDFAALHDASGRLKQVRRACARLPTFSEGPADAAPFWRGSAHRRAPRR